MNIQQIKYISKINFRTIGTVALASAYFSGAEAPLPLNIKLVNYLLKEIE